MPAYHSAFDAGEYVTVADLNTLRAFQQSWEWHHPLTDDQLAFAGRNVCIKSVSYYHGGTTLYEFVDIPGVWHESCLRDPTLSPESFRDREAGAIAGDYYAVSADRRGGLPVVIVRDPAGRELLVAFQFYPERAAEAMREVACVRSRINFEYKYGFNGIYEANKRLLDAT
jgi:hypothetical protein